MNVINENHQVMLRLLIVILISLLFPHHSLADETENIKFGEEDAQIELGYFLPSFNTRFRIDSDALGVGDEVDLEDDLGFDREKSIVRLEGYYRLAKRHRLKFGYFGFTRASTQQIDKEFQIGDQTYAINTTIRSEIKQSIYDIGYDYSFWRGTNYDVALGLGIHVIDMEWQIENSSGGQVERTDATAPLPLLTLDVNYMLSQNWRVGAYFKYLALEIGEYKGKFTNLRAKLEYYPYKHVGFGLGIDHFDMEISANKTEFKGRLDWRYTGAQIYTTIRF